MYFTGWPGLSKRQNLGGSVVVVEEVVVDIVVLGVVDLTVKICQGTEGYLGGTVGIMGVGGKVGIFQLFGLVGHLLGLGFCHEGVRVGGGGGGRVLGGGLVLMGGSV